MARCEGCDRHGEDPWKALPDERGVLPFVGGELDGRIHDEEVQDHPCGEHGSLGRIVRWVDDAVDELPGEVAAQWQDGHAVGAVLVRVVYHGQVVDRPSQSLGQQSPIRYPGNFSVLGRCR